MRNRLCAATRVLVAAFCACVPASALAGAFVARSGTSLTLVGQPWRFVGFNDYQLTPVSGGFSCGRTVDQATLNSILADAQRSGATAIRTWFFESYYDLGAQRQAITPTYAAFDRVLTAAAADGLKVIPVLVNEWQDCEPPSVDKNLGFFQSGYKSPGYGYPLAFRTYATTVARHYAADTRIAFWQLGNELESNTPQSVHAGKVDLCEYHDYGDTVHAVPGDAYNGLAVRINQCRAIGKPLFVGEAGIVADAGDYGQSTGQINSTTLAVRAGFFGAKLTAAFANGLVGYLLWDKQQDASNSAYNLNNGRYSVGPGDPANVVVRNALATAPGSLRYGFEDGGLDGWNVAWGPLSLYATTTEAWGGRDALALNLGGGVAYPAARTQAMTGAGPGTTITYHLYVPSWAPAGLQAMPYVSNNAWAQTFSAAVDLTYGWTSSAGSSPPVCRCRSRRSASRSTTDPAGPARSTSTTSPGRPAGQTSGGRRIVGLNGEPASAVRTSSVDPTTYGTTS